MKNKNFYFMIGLITLYLLLNYNSLIVSGFLITSFKQFLLLDQYQKANFITPVSRVILLVTYLIFISMLRRKINEFSILEILINTFTMLFSIEIVLHIIESSFKYYQLSQSEMAKSGIINFSGVYQEDLIKSIAFIVVAISIRLISKYFINKKKPNIA